MTTSGTISATLLASDIATRSMRALGLLSAGESPTGEELEDILVELTIMLKAWQARGVTSWLNTEESITFPAGTSSLTLTPYCLGVLDARLIQSPGYERPLQRWELAQYRQIPNKATPGYPTAYTINKTDAAVEMIVWPVPITDLIVNYSCVRVIEDVTDGAQTVDVPQMWLAAVVDGLAVRIAPSFGMARIDPNTLGLIAKRAAASEQLLLDQDRPASVYMGSSYGRVF